MKLKSIAAFLLCLLFCQNNKAQNNNKVSVTMNRVRLEFKLSSSSHIPEYAVYFNDQPVVLGSRMGFILDHTVRLDSDLVINKVDSNAVDDSWKPVWGEVNSIRDHYKQLTILLHQRAGGSRSFVIAFRVFEDGVGFRYSFPVQRHLKYFTVTKELTEFNMAGNHKTFWIPGDYDSNEYPYTTSNLSEVDAWKLPMLSFGNRAENIPDQYAVQTPLMMKTSNGLYINIHEAALVNYPSMQLHVNRDNYSLSASLVPGAMGDLAYLRAPARTPWRTIIVSDKATDILASKMILNLNAPSVIKNTSWIRPTKFMGVWWEMQTGRSNWSYTNNLDSLSPTNALIPNGRHAANTANVKHYIDFASKNGIKGLLVEGWNTGWEEWFGNWVGGHFDFVTPYPDFDIKEVARYAKLKGVQMIMHNETGADASTYDSKMDTAFRLMNHYGYTAVKTGYVGRIIPRGEHHDGQWMADHYIRAAQTAAQYKIMIDMHEPVRPTGLSRTYPNWLASEAGRGNEWNAFSFGSPPEHETIMPFTRLMGGPMDYTPGIFKLRNYAAGDSQRQMHTTLAKQLALYVTMYSPLQMAADIPENYEAHMDAFQFIKEVPVDWDDTRVLEAEPGSFITIARKEKGKNNWFIGSITNADSRRTSVPLSFLDKGAKYEATIYADADNADWRSNPEAYKITHLDVNTSSSLEFKLAPGGGVAVSIKRVK